MSRVHACAGVVLLLLSLGVAACVALLTQEEASRGRGSLQLNAAYGLHRLALDMEQAPWDSLCLHTARPPYAVAFNSCAAEPDADDAPLGVAILSPLTGAPLWQAQHVYYAWPGVPPGALMLRRVPLPEPRRQVPSRLSPHQLVSLCDGSGVPVAFGITRLGTLRREEQCRALVLRVSAGAVSLQARVGMQP